jgi:hypothetical protein
MTDFIRNLVLRGSGLVPPVVVQPMHQPQFPPALMSDRGHHPLSRQTPVKAASTSPRQDAGEPAPNEVEPNMGRSSSTDNGLPASEKTSPATFFNQTPHSLAQPQEPEQTLPAPVSSPAEVETAIRPASLETYPEPTPQMESASYKINRPHSENKLVESSPFPDQIELRARSTVEPASLTPAPPGITSLSSQDTERSEVQSVLRSTPAAQSVDSRHRHFEDQPLESKQSPGKTESLTHQENQSISPAAPLNIHNLALSVVEPILITPRQVPVTPGLDNSWTYPVNQPSLPVAPLPAVSSPPTVEVHIGTLEVRANQPLPASPLPLAPKPQGFQDYAHMRGWDGE